MKNKIAKFLGLLILSVLSVSLLQASTIRINDADNLEGEVLSFTVKLSEKSDTATVIKLNNTNITTSDNDYEMPISPTFIIPEGETSYTININTIEDYIEETTESFKLNVEIVEGKFKGARSTGLGIISNVYDMPTKSLKLSRITSPSSDSSAEAGKATMISWKNYGQEIQGSGERNRITYTYALALF